MMPTNPLARLETLVGRWQTTGRLFDGDQPIEGTDVYELDAKEMVIRHEAKVRMGDEPTHSVEFIGYEPVHERYASREEGSGATAVLRLEGQHFTIVSATTRFDGDFTADQSELSGTWERLVGGRWERWMEIRLRRLTRPA